MFFPAFCNNTWCEFLTFKIGKSHHAAAYDFPHNSAYTDGLGSSCVTFLPMERMGGYAMAGSTDLKVVEMTNTVVGLAVLYPVVEGGCLWLSLAF